MRNTNEADQKRTLRAKLSHPDVGQVGEGNLTFGYSCTATFSFDGFAPQVRPTASQLAEGLIAEAEDGTKWSLFGCNGFGHSLFIDFVVQGGISAGKVRKFDVRYSDVSDWFFPQMRIDEELGAKIKWTSMPTQLVAEVAQHDLNFRCESHYDATLVQRGEDRVLHQHFEFHFTATQDPFTLVLVRDLARQFSQLLSLLLAHPCSIVSIDVFPDAGYGGRLYYGVSKSPIPSAQATADPSCIDWRAFFANKNDVDRCWDDVVKKFFQSKHRDVVWARLAGMQNFEGFWEYRILGYVTLLDRYVSTEVKKGPSLRPTTRKLKRLEDALAGMTSALTSSQTNEVLDAVATLFSSTESFESKFEGLVASLDKGVVHVINFHPQDFERIKELRDEVAHGDEISYKSSDLTLMLTVMHRLVLLLTYLFFREVGLGSIFVRTLDRTRNELRLRADVDRVHLDRVLRPSRFFKVSAEQLEVIKARSRRLFSACFVFDVPHELSYSPAYSQRLQDALTSKVGGHSYQRLELPGEAVRDLGEAYFEHGTDVESVHSVVIIDRSLLPA